MGEEDFNIMWQVKVSMYTLHEKDVSLDERQYSMSS